MKVRIAYTIDYEEVPRVVNELMADLKEKMRTASEIKLFDEQRLDKFVEDIQAIKSLMSTIDAQLTDCLNMAIGYVNADAELEDIDDIQEDQQ